MPTGFPVVGGCVAGVKGAQVFLRGMPIEPDGGRFRQPPVLPRDNPFLPRIERLQMMRAPHTLALLAAAVGVPYAATETDLGRSAVQSLSTKTASLETPAPPPPPPPETSNDTSQSNEGDSVPVQRELERIWEKSIDRYRYSSTPLVVGGPKPPTEMFAAATVSSRTARGVVSDEGDEAASSPFLGPTPPGTLVGGPIHDLREVLRFDITPEWVTSRFSRVTTVLAATELEGLRVPVVTGIGPSDLAGTLTYYFDYSGKLQRVMLHGFTGDVSRVVESMTQHYGLQAEPTLDAGVYTRRWNAQPVHFLRITRAPVVYSDALHHKFTVFLELNQPNLPYGISADAEQIIGADRGIGRW